MQKKDPIFKANLIYISERQWQPTPVLLPGKSHGWRSLVGCSPWGREESDTTERLHFHFSFSCIGEGNGNPLQCSCLETPRDRGAWWATVCGVALSWTWLKRLSSSMKYYFLRSLWKENQHEFIRKPLKIFHLRKSLVLLLLPNIYFSWGNHSQIQSFLESSANKSLGFCWLFFFLRNLAQSQLKCVTGKHLKLLLLKMYWHS